MAKRRAGFPAASPEEAHMSGEPFAQLRAAVRRNVGELGALAGCAHIVLRDGRCVFACAEGRSNIERGVRFSLDTLCPLHGATKPLVAAAFLTLVDEGKVKLSDPISKHLPFPSSVKTGPEARVQQVAEVPTLRHLLTMTAGVGYDDCPNYAKAMKQVQKGTIGDLRGLCDAIAGAPLEFQPGRKYCYGFSADLLGHLCERVSGQSIHTFLRQRLLRPLGMKDTYMAQALPQRKRKRLAVLYLCKQQRKAPKPGARLARPARGATPYFSLKRWVPKASAPGIVSCGGGILSYADYGGVSSARDYARFCQMLLDGGLAANGKRVLKASTVQALWQDGLGPFQRRDGRLPGWNDTAGPGGAPQSYWDGMGWSLLNAHLVLPGKPGPTSRRGTCMWMGGGGGAFWSIDSKRRIAVVSFAPGLKGRAWEEDGFGPLANDACPFAEAAVDEAKPKRRRLAP